MKKKLVVLSIYIFLLILLSLAFVLAGRTTENWGHAFERMYYLALIAKILSICMLVYTFVDFLLNNKSKNDIIYFLGTGILVIVVLYFLFF